MNLKELQAQRETAERLLQTLDALAATFAEQRDNLQAWVLELDSQILDVVMS